jgi:hypothetical protein
VVDGAQLVNTSGLVPKNLSTSGAADAYISDLVAENDDLKQRLHVSDEKLWELQQKVEQLQTNDGIFE